MFFVGATGQLLTLILTIGLPFILLISGHKKVELNQNTKRIEVYQEINLSNFILKEDSSSFPLVAEETIQQNLIIHSLPLKKNPPLFNLVDWHYIELTSSGNKAPPSCI